MTDQVQEQAPQQELHPMQRAILQFVNEAFVIEEAAARIRFLKSYIENLETEVEGIRNPEPQVTGVTETTEDVE